MKQQFLQFWYDALASEVGIVIETNSRERCKQQLYAARKESGDPALEALSVETSPNNPDQLWITKRRLLKDLELEIGPLK